MNANNPTSDVQTGFFLSSRLHPGTSLNTVSGVVGIHGPLDERLLAFSVSRLLARHSALRTTLRVQEDSVVSAISDYDPTHIPLEVIEAQESAVEPETDRLRRSLSPESAPWKVLLLKHEDNHHTLVFVAHRSLVDRVSLRVLAVDLSSMYNSGIGEPEGPDWPEIEAQTGNAGEGAAYFASGLAGIPSVHGFPLANQRPRFLTVDTGTVDIGFGDTLARNLSDYAKKIGIDPFVVFVSASSYILARFSGQRSISIGFPFSLRDERASRLAVGCLTAILPLGVDTGEGTTFASMTEGFTARVAGAMPFASTSFKEIAKTIGSKSDPAVNPLFQIAFEKEAEFEPSFEGCQCRQLRVSAPAQQLDLFFQYSDDGMRIAYSSAIISIGVVKSLGRSITAFLSAALADPGRLTSELNVLGEADRRSLVVDLNSTDKPSFLETDLYGLVTGQFSPHGRKTAIICGGATIDYESLGRLVDSVASTLILTVDGGLVGICLPRSIEMVVAMLAVLKVGKAYVPLDPAFPRERLGYMIEHSGLDTIITTDDLRPSIERPGIRFATVDRSAKPVLNSAPVAVPGESPAYIIYTSGSTGKPKGVAVQRAALANFLSSMLEKPGIGSTDIICAITTLSFDIAELELLAPLCAGGTVVIATDEEARDPKRLGELVRDSRATLLQATPVMWQMLLATGWEGSLFLKALCGGEAMPHTLAQALVPRVKELWNMYGPTETTVWSTCQRIENPHAPISVGLPVANTRVYVLDEFLRPVPAGVEGQLYIGGSGVSLGYLHDSRLTALKFHQDPFAGSGRMYDTGDRARFDSSGSLFIVGRSDFQVKLRGFRIELGEIESRLDSFPGISRAIASVRRDDPDNPELVAYYTMTAGFPEPTVSGLRKHCSEAIPSYMIPSHFIHLESLPLTPNGKVDRNALPSFPKTETAMEHMEAEIWPRGDVEKSLAEIWRTVVPVEFIGMNDSFFDLGGTSIAALAVSKGISERFQIDFSILRIFEYPTLSAQAAFLKGLNDDLSFVRKARSRAEARRKFMASPTAFDVAIIGAAGRFPGASGLEELWDVLKEGRETVTVYDRKDLDPLVPDKDRDDPAYIPARGVLAGIDMFDGAFFGISPNEAEIMDPQQRLFLEVSWEAFENSGYVGEDIDGLVGVWAAKGNDFYYIYNVLTRPDKLAIMGEIAAEIANEKDHIAPRVSHKLNLTGPSLSVHTACSSTLIVVENAYQALVTGQVDVALAGGIDIRTPQRSGQRYEEGGVFSIDGHCRPFDAAATGTMFGEGVGAIVMKRLDDALRDKDNILAVIKGAAANHDGGRKVSYLAPSVDGQARVIAAALALGDVDPDTVSYVEAHGTGTPIGDPIEVEALTRVFRASTQRKEFCAIGSIKSNFGHTTTAAGIAGIIKIILSMRNKQIPATIHYSVPNPRIDFRNSPFFVNSKLIDWNPPGIPRRAGISSFGFCGTNAHIVLEEAPVTPPPSIPSRPLQLLLVSARVPKALDASAKDLAGAMEGMSRERFADAAYTTHVGRKRFEYRRCALAGSAEEAAVSLVQAAGPASLSLKTEIENPPVAFMFPGQGAQYVNMGLEIYRGEPVFMEAVDRCAKTLEPHLGCDLRDFLFPDPEDEEKATESLNNTFYTQPAIYTISYSLALLLKSWGLEPTAFIGHSIGEFVAATLSGVMELEDALRLVAVRGKLMQSLPRGSMLSVRMSEEELVSRLPAGLDLATINSPKLCVVAGLTPVLEIFAKQLEGEGVACRMLHTSHAFHSSMMEPIIETFQETVESIRLSPPLIPFVSTVTGDWISLKEATDPAYWARHLRSTVLFSKAVRVLLEDGQRTLIECGPRRTCSSLALQHQPVNPGRILAAMPDSAEPRDEYPSVLLALGGAWLNGCTIDWVAFHRGEDRRRIALPTYPFQRRHYWIEPGNTSSFGLGPGIEATVSDQTPLTVKEADEGVVQEGLMDPVLARMISILEDCLGEKFTTFNENARFIELGMDSLLLTQLARIVRQKLGFDVTFRQLFAMYSTTRLLVDAINAAQGDSSRAISATNPTDIENMSGKTSISQRQIGFHSAQELPVSPAQREIWETSQASPDACRAFNKSLVIRLRGRIDDTSLLAAICKLPEYHEALRGRFSEDGRFFFLFPIAKMKPKHHDLSSRSQDAQETALEEIERTDVTTAYDLRHGPLFRATMVTISQDERVVILGAHASVCDEWSMDVLLYDLGRIYSNLVAYEPMPQFPRHGYVDFVSHCAKDGFLASRKTSLAFWEERLASLSMPPPYGRDTHASLSQATFRMSRVISAETLVPVREWVKSRGLSLFSVILAAWANTLHTRFGAQDFLIGVPVAGHLEADMEDCVGPLVNTVPIRFNSWSPSFMDMCQAANTSVLDARENSSVGFGEIAESIRAASGTGMIPSLLGVFVDIQKYPDSKLKFGSLSIDYQLNPKAFGIYDLDLIAFESSGQIELMVDANEALFSTEWIIETLKCLMAQLLQNPVGIDTNESSNASCTFLLSPSQERNYFAAQRGPGIPFAYRIDGPLDVDVLTSVLKSFVERHQAIRSVFLDSEDGIRFAFQESVLVELRQHEGLIGMEKAVAEPFDLLNGPLFRFDLYSNGPEEHVFLAVFSQMVFDGTSLQIFLRELTTGYDTLVSKRAWDPGKPGISYGEYARRRGGEVETLRSRETVWWKKCLGEEIPGALIPVDHARPVMPSYAGAVVPFDFPAEVVGSIRATARAYGVTVQMVCLSALFILVNRLSNRSDCWVATPVAGRSDADEEDLIGAFSNMVLLKSKVEQDLSFGVYLCRVRDICFEAYEHQNFPLDQIGLRINQADADGRAPLFQIEFDYEKTELWNHKMGTARLSGIQVHGKFAANELTFWMRDSGSAIFGSLEYASQLFDKETVSHWLSCYIRILKDATSAPDKAISELDVLGEDYDLVARTTTQALISRSAMLPIPDDCRPEQLRVVDDANRPIPLGAWGNLTDGNRVILRSIRVKTDATWETAQTPVGVSKHRKKLRTRVFDPVEYHMIESFEKVLGLEGIELQDNFFDLGGHSTMAVLLMNRLKRHYGTSLSLGVLFEAPTPYAMAKIIRRECHLPDPDTGLLDDKDIPAVNSVVPIQVHGSLPPLFVAAGIGGNPMNLRYISKYLGNDQPFYGLQHRGTDGRHRPHNRVPDLVNEYVTDILKVQPTGPYFLGGFSAGGIAAFEVARALIESGEHVGLVVMFDADSPLAQYVRLSKLDKFKADGVLSLADALWSGINRRVSGYATMIGSSLAKIFPFQFRNQAVVVAWRNAMKRYVPTPCKVDVLVLRASDRDPGSRDPTNGWDALVTGSLTVIPVAGDHTSHVGPPFVENLVDILKAELQKARAKP